MCLDSAREPITRPVFVWPQYLVATRTVDHSVPSGTRALAWVSTIQSGEQYT
jgi:hypothetical protein